MVRCFMFQWGWVVFQMGGFIFKWGDALWRVSVLMGRFRKNSYTSPLPAFPPLSETVIMVAQNEKKKKNGGNFFVAILNAC